MSRRPTPPFSLSVEIANRDHNQQQAPSASMTDPAEGAHASSRRESLKLCDVGPQLAGQWLGLATTSDADLSMAPQWFSSMVKARKVEDHARIFTLHHENMLVAVAPYVIRAEAALGIKARSRELPGNYLVAYHPEVIATIELEAVLEELLEDCADSSDVLVLPNLEKDGRTARAAHGVARKLGLDLATRPGHVSPYLTIEGDWESYLGSKRKKFRYKARAALKELHEKGEFVARWFTEPEHVEELLSAMLHIEARSWKVAANMAITGSDMEQNYHRMLLPFLASHRALQANVLYLDSSPIAYSLCYLSNRKVRQLKTSFDEEYSNLSVGSVVHRLAIQNAFEMNAQEFDFLGDAMPHKMQWATGVREHETLYLYLRNWRSFVVSKARKLKARMRHLTAGR